MKITVPSLTRTLFAVALAATTAVGCADETEPGSDTEAPESAKPIGLTRTEIVASLHALALDTSKRWGVEAPATVHAVATADHQAAESVISGAIINDHSPVYVVQVTGGTFTALRHPRDIEPPHGKVLTITYDAATLRMTDVGIDDIAPELVQIDREIVDLQPVSRAP
jgi:hypothetical protein